MPMISPTDVTRRIESIRRQKGWTQEELARLLGISQPAVSKYLRDRIPPATILLRLARLGNTTMEWLLSGEKSYLYETTRVREKSVFYDADYSVVKKIAALPPEVREALETLIDSLSRPKGESGGR